MRMAVGLAFFMVLLQVNGQSLPDYQTRALFFISQVGNGRLCLNQLEENSKPPFRTIHCLDPLWGFALTSTATFVEGQPIMIFPASYNHTKFLVGVNVTNGDIAFQIPASTVLTNLAFNPST